MNDPSNKIREVGQKKGDVLERFTKLQRTVMPLSKRTIRKKKVEKFKTVQDLNRPPDRNDLVALCRELNRLQAKYIVIGGLAMNVLGLIRTTEDIDFLIEESPQNQDKVKEALRILPDKAIDELGQEDIKDFVVVRINDEITVDLMTQACGFTYDRVRDLIRTKTFDDVVIPFAGRELMIKTKQTVREKDRIDLLYLESIQDTDDGR